MKESTNKTSTRAQAGKSKTEGKSTSRTTAACKQSGRTTGSRTSRVNNPEGHNQYTKK